MFFFKKRRRQDPVEHRSAYRAVPEGIGELGVQLSGAELEPLAAELVDLNMHGAGLRLPGGELNAGLVKGELYELRLSSHYHADVVTPVELRAAEEEPGGGWHYGFEFVDLAGLDAQLDESFVRHFNRRAEPRLRLVAQERIQLTLTWDGGSRRFPLSDISAQGAGFTLSAQDLPPVSEGDEVGVAFRLPGVKEPCEGTATLARLTLLADRFVIGLAFHLDDPAGLGRSAEALQRFVDERRKLRQAWNTLAG